MQVIVGPRQVGKSTLIGQILEVCNMPYDSYSADDVVGASADWLAGVWQTARMRMDIRGEGKRLLVVDEIQKINNWSETVKAEWDRDTREKRELIVVLLGSSRMLIEKGLTESLAGRYELIRLTHWTFPEMRECFVGISTNMSILVGIRAQHLISPMSVVGETTSKTLWLNHPSRRMC